jgi:Malectin domain
MAAKVTAYEQIFAINSGGAAHTDSDGIVYQERSKKYGNADHQSWVKLHMGTVPESDRNIYNDYEYSNDGSSIEYDLPIKNDGLYVLIAKFAYSFPTKSELTLNSDVQLLSNLDLIKLCGNRGKICDVYFYFCVSAKTLYFQNQSSPIQDEKIHFKIIRSSKSYVRDSSRISGLVLLKGTLGEIRKLASSATHALLFFDPAHTHPKCLPTPSLLNETQTIQEEIQPAMPSCEQMDIKFEKLQSELASQATKMDQANRVVLEVQTEQVNLGLQISEISKQLTEIHNLLQKSVGDTKFIVADSEI